MFLNRGGNFLLFTKLKRIFLFCELEEEEEKEEAFQVILPRERIRNEEKILLHPKIRFSEYMETIVSFSFE